MSKKHSCPSCHSDSGEVPNTWAPIDLSVLFYELWGTIRCPSCKCVWKPPVATTSAALMLTGGILLLIFGVLCISLFGTVTSTFIGATKYFLGGSVFSIFGLNLAIYGLLGVCGLFTTAAILGRSENGTMTANGESYAARRGREQFSTISGYAYAIFALFILPPIFGLMAVLVGRANRKAGRKRHAQAQITLGIICAVVGLLYGVSTA